MAAPAGIQQLVEMGPVPGWSGSGEAVRATAQQHTHLLEAPGQQLVPMPQGTAAPEMLAAVAKSWGN